MADHRFSVFPVQTGVAFFFPFDPMGMRSKETELKVRHSSVICALKLCREEHARTCRMLT